MDFSMQDILFKAFGGLAIFLFGIKFMSEGLQNVAGQRLRVFLEKGTKTPVRGVLTGTLVTALIQSSSGTTVLTVGLVNAGLLTLRQAIGIIMGANIGTTLTAYLIGFNLKHYALPIVAVGGLLLFFFKNKSVINFGQVVFGFGLLFYGMDVMGSGLKPLKEMPFFTDLMLNVEDTPLLGVAIGTVFTMLVQSSSATIGILQELASQGSVTYMQAVPILFGDNIGTTITALLAAIGTSVAAKRTAMTHMLFNISGTAIFLPLTLIGVFPEVVKFVTNYIFILLPGFEGTWETLNIRMQIAQTHGVFNITNTMIQLPFVSVLAYVVTKLVPGEMVQFDVKPRFLEPRLLSQPAVALKQAHMELVRMGKHASDFFNDSVKFFFNTKDKELNPLYLEQREQLINTLEEEITNYVTSLTSGVKLTQEQSNYASTLLHAVNDLERIGDHADNIVELSIYAVENKVSFSEEALESIKAMAQLTSETLRLSLEALENNDHDLARKVIQNEVIIDNLEREFRQGHIARLNERKCTGIAGAVFIDMLSNLERIGDHSVNIAEYVLGDMGAVERTKVKYSSSKIAYGSARKD
ncbi:phosphate:Na+ symporter [Desulfohalotomaculum tongense]|uniref:Na/Pi cotransporter family protein n=1 Tax=Desulforadius tongensis TaxID=1216062 RepID=UPI00195E3C06|nr:Na/Pi cotransporter family protein [Desulforadius tongensis]MBM7854088.1 phosphate:Na+ symporter [Desulforadius tongensis]